MQYKSLAFGEFRLESGRLLRSKDGSEIRLRPKSFEVLAYLVNHPNRLVTKDEIFAAVWGPTVVTDDSLTQCLIDVRRAIGDHAHEAIRTVPRRGFVFEIPVRTIDPGETPAKGDASAAGIATAPPRRRRRVIALAAVLTLVAASAWWALPPRSTDTPPEPPGAAPSIAVLPFIDLSARQDQQYFAEGLSEEILNLLARIPELRVIARTSSFSFRGANTDIEKIARQLDVTHVLEGSVRKAGDRVRITAQLVNASNSSHLWSETYDRTLEDIFVIQDEVAAHVVQQLQLRLALGPPKAPRSDPKAYLLYLQAKQIVASADQFEMHKARRLLEEALRIDPAYVDAMVTLSLAYWHLGQLAARDGKMQERIAHEELMDKLLDQARRTDPDNASLNGMLGWQALLEDSDLATAARCFTESLQTNPRHTHALQGALQVFMALGNLDLAVRVGEFLASRAPLDYWAHAHLADALLKHGDTAKAVARQQLAVAVGPRVEGARWKLGLALLVSGDAAGALEQFDLEDPKHPYGLQGRALALFDLGRLEEHRAAMVELESWAAEFWPYGLARAYAWIGDTDKAFHYLQLAEEQHAEVLQGEVKNPIFAKITGDPRWLAFIEATGVSPEQLAHITFSPRLPAELLAPSGMSAGE